MRILIRIAGILLIISAITLFFWQDIREYFTDQVNDRVIDAYHNGDDRAEVSRVESMITGIEAEGSESIEIGEGMAGVLKIDAADINEPLYEGPVTEEKLRNGVSFVNASDHLDMQNIPIAGHRVEGAGIRFNYLDRAEVGDTIELITHEDARVYEVTDIFEVDPSQVEVMDQREDFPQQLTLITCEDYNPETLLFEKRMIVKATIAGEF